MEDHVRAGLDSVFFDSVDTFEIPCPPDAGGPDVDGGPAGSGNATGIPFDKVGTATSRSFGIGNFGRRFFSVRTGDSQLFEFDPATPGVAQRSKLAATDLTSFVSLPDGSMILSGKASLGPWIGKRDGAGDIAWASRFGLDNDYPKQVSALDATRVAVPLGNGFRVAEVDVSVTGGAATIRTFDAGPQGKIWGANAVVPLLGGGYVVGGDIMVQEFLVHDLGVIAVDANRSIIWQKRFATGGQNSLTSLLPLTDGGVIVGGRLRKPGGGALGGDNWLARFSGNGTLVWQRTYGSEDVLEFSSAVQTPTGFALVATADKGIAVVLLDTDGNVTRARSFADSQAAGDEGSAGIALLNPTTLVFNSMAAMTHSFYTFETAFDLKVGGCADAMIGVDIATSTIPTGTPTVTITDSTFVSAVVDATNTAMTIPVVKDTVVTANLCAN